MLSKLTYHKKNNILIVVFVLFSLICFKLAISKTVAAFQINKNLTNEINSQKDFELKRKSILKKLSKLESNLYSNNVGIENHEQMILTYVTKYCFENNLLLKEFPKTIITRNNEYEVQTNTLNVSGKYHSILNLVYYIEHINKISQITAIHYRIKKDVYNREKELIATIYLQKISRDKKIK